MTKKTRIVRHKPLFIFKITLINSPFDSKPDLLVVYFLIRRHSLVDSVVQSSNSPVYLGCLLGGVYVPDIYHMPGGVIVGDSGLCCCGPTFNV